MNEFITSMLVLAAEFGVLIGIFVVVLMIVFIIRRKKEADIAARFTQGFKESSTERKDKLEKAMADTYQLDGPESKSYAAEILNNERTICSNVLRIFHGKDKDLLLRLQDDLASLTGAYHNLARRCSKEEVQENNNEKADNDTRAKRMQSELEILRQENERLKEDLKKSLVNIDYLQTQYTELFDKTSND